MNKDLLQGKLKQLRDAVKQRWGVLTDKDLGTVDGKLHQLPGLLQEKYGYTREQAKKETRGLVHQNHTNSKIRNGPGTEPKVFWTAMKRKGALFGE